MYSDGVCFSISLEYFFFLLFFLLFLLLFCSAHVLNLIKILFILIYSVIAFHTYLIYSIILIVLIILNYPVASGSCIFDYPTHLFYLLLSLLGPVACPLILVILFLYIRTLDTFALFAVIVTVL